MDKDIVIQCPHCKDYVLISELNCHVFRHAYFKNTHQQIPPHMPKEDIDKLREGDHLIGCGMPFRLIKIEDHYTAVICDYI